MTIEDTHSGRQGIEDLAVVEVIAQVVKRRGLQAWLVGGSVRDRALGREAPDLDVVVTAEALGVTREVAKRVQAPWFVLSDRHHAYRIVRPGGCIDIALLRGSSIEEDLSLRDFTINAIAVVLPDQEIVDPFQGLRHLRERRLVAVTDRIFEDDPLRLMRAARFVHVLGFALDPCLDSLLRSQVSLLAGAAPERVAAELVLTLREGRSAAALALWRDLGLLEQFLPESPAVRNPSPTAEVLACLEDMLACPKGWFPDEHRVIRERMGVPVDGAVERPVALRLAALLVGAAPEEAACAGERLRLSGDLTSLLVCAARFLGNRAWLDGLTKDLGRPLSTPGRDVTLFFWKTKPWEMEVLLLAAACESAAAGQGNTQLKLSLIRWLLSVWAWRTRGEIRSLPVDGKILMREFELLPGPLVGELLREIRLAWEAGEISTYKEAVQVARSYLSKAELRTARCTAD